MVVAQKDDRENLRIRLRPEVNRAFDELTERKRVKKQDAIDGLVEWFLLQDSRLQSLIIGQIEPEYHAEIIEKVLGNLTQNSKAAAGKYGMKFHTSTAKRAAQKKDRDKQKGDEDAGDGDGG